MNRSQGAQGTQGARRTKSKDDARRPEAFRAYVLIQAVPGRVAGICRSLVRMPAVVSIDSVTGPYDIVALIEFHEPREIGQVVAGSIGGVRGVTRTTTLLCT